MQKFDVPLPRATTPSLEALHAYSLALDEARVNPRLEAIPHLKRAIELDPDFALALALLSTRLRQHRSVGAGAGVRAAAFELRDRVSERERFFISWRYYRDATQDWDEGARAGAIVDRDLSARSVRLQQPGIALLPLRPVRARRSQPLRNAIRLDPRFVAPYGNLATGLTALGRWDEAKEVLRNGATLGISSFPFKWMTYRLAFYEADTATTNRMLEASIGVGQTHAAHGWQAHAEAFSGEGAPRPAAVPARHSDGGAKRLQ